MSTNIMKYLLDMLLSRNQIKLLSMSNIPLKKSKPMCVYVFYI